MNGFYLYNLTRAMPKATVEQCLHLDVKWLDVKGHMGRRVAADIAWTDPRTGIREAGADLTLDLRTPYGLSVHIGSTQKGTGTPYSQEVPLTATEPFYGGLRWWFRCPLCGRRVRKLYMPEGGHFACRTCHDLSYDSCQDSHRWDRLFADLAREVYGQTSEEHVTAVSRGLRARIRR